MNRRWQRVALSATFTVLVVAGTVVYAASAPSGAVRAGAAYARSGASAAISEEQAAEYGRRFANSFNSPDMQIPSHQDVMEQFHDLNSGRDSRAIREKIRANMAARDQERRDVEARDAKVAEAQREMLRAAAKERLDHGDGGRAGRDGFDHEHTDHPDRSNYA